MAFALERADNLRKNGLDAKHKIDYTSKEATDLLEIVATATEACGIFKELETEILGDKDTVLAVVEGTLKAILEDTLNTGKLRIRAASKAMVLLTEDEIEEIQRLSKAWYLRYIELRNFKKKHKHCCISFMGSVPGSTQKYKVLGKVRRLFVKLRPCKLLSDN